MPDTPGKDRPDGISVLIPCSNERLALPSVIATVAAALTDGALPWEIIVADDGSTDGSGEAAAEEARRGIAVKVVRHETTLGYGAALKTAGRASQYNRLVLIDADGTYPAARIPELVALLEGNAMAIGARVGRDAAIPNVRRPAKWFITRLASYTTGRKIPDLNSGMRAVRWELWRRTRRFFPEGFSLTTTLTMAALSANESVAFLPIAYAPRTGTSKIRPIRDTLNFVQLILRMTLYFNPLKIFVPLSIALIGAGLVIGVASLLEGKLMDATMLLLVLTGVQMLAIGGLADLIIKRVGGRDDEK